MALTFSQAASLPSLSLPRGGSMGQGGTGAWSSPTPAGSAPVRTVKSIPFTSQTTSAFPARTYSQTAPNSDLMQFVSNNRLAPSSPGYPAPDTAFGYAPPSPANPAASAAAAIASNSIPLPRRSPVAIPGQSTRMEDDLIAQGVQPGVPLPSNINAVNGEMQANPKLDLGGLLGLFGGGLGGGLLQQFTGPSKNGLGGLAGLLGGPQQGGLIQMLMGGMPRSSRVPGTPIDVLATDSPAAAKAKAAGRAGYVASDGMLMPTTSISGKSRRTEGDAGGSSSRSGNGSWATGSSSGSPFW